MTRLRKLFHGAAAFVSVVVTAATVLTLSPAPASAAPTAACGAGTSGSEGYAYAGHQAGKVSHGVRAAITATTQPLVSAGHVAGWVGVGGPGQGPNGETEWVQVGLASLPNTPTMLYAEITEPNAEPRFLSLVPNVQVGETHEIGVLEVGGRPNWWRVWVDGRAVTEPIFLPGSHRRWEPIVTAESYNNRQPVCNRFAFRFERVSVATSLGGAWKQFVPGYDFLDTGYAIRPLRPAASSGTVRTLSSDPAKPYAFEAVSV